MKTNNRLILGVALLALSSSLLAGCSNSDNASGTDGGAAKTGVPASSGSKQTD